jgi:hypothetical protein
MDNVIYWPFEVLPLEERTELQRKEIRFFEDAFREGFKPHLWHGEYRASSNTGREGWIIWRGRRRENEPTQWEVRLFANQSKLVASFWLDEFDYVSHAMLEWLRGAETTDILSKIGGHLVKGPIFEPS